MYNINDEFGLPKDVTKKELLCQIVGRNQLILENYKCIKCFSDEEIIVLCHTYSLHIKGKDMCINYYNNESMIIGGNLYEISFL